MQMFWESFVNNQVTMILHAMKWLHGETTVWRYTFLNMIAYHAFNFIDSKKKNCYLAS
jgi:hypothetical protein